MLSKSRRLQRRANCQLRNIRKSRGLSVVDVAINLDVGETSVSTWETGRVPDALVMADLCALLECSLDDLYPEKV